MGNRFTTQSKRVNRTPREIRSGGTDLAQTHRKDVKKQQGQGGPPPTPIPVPKGATLLKVKNIGAEDVEIRLNAGAGQGWLLIPNEKDEFPISDKVVFRATAPNNDTEIQYAFG